MAWPKGKPRPKGSGRKRGTPNKVTAEARAIFAQVLEKSAPELEAWLRECAQGIEIEKTLENGQTVIGRFGADPGKAVDLVLKLAEFSFPKLSRVEKTIIDATDEEILQEVTRRANEAKKAEGG